MSPDRAPRRAWLLAALTTLLAGCSGQFWANALTPPWGHSRVTEIAYGDRPRQKLDIYIPNAPAPGAPVVVFFYGGSWQSGNKDDYRFVGQALTARGLIAVLPDYRLYPPATFPAFVADAARAVAWTRAHIGDYGGGCHLFLAGHSAGAHIAALLATDGRYLARAGTAIDAVSGFIGMAGPYDFLPIRDPTLQTIFAPRSDWPATQPIRFVDGDEPPMLLLAGGADHTVDPGNSRRLAAAVNDAGGSARLAIYPGVGHVRLLAPLAAPLRFLGDQLDRIDRFVTRLTAATPCPRRRQ